MTIRTLAIAVALCGVIVAPASAQNMPANCRREAQAQGVDGRGHRDGVEFPQSRSGQSCGRPRPAR